MADDVFFGPQTGKLAEIKQRERDWERLRREHETAGYRDGAATAREGELQSGFNAGFQMGAKDVADGGYWLGVASALLTLKEKLQNGENNDDSALVDLRKSKDALLKELKSVGVDQSVDGERCMKACKNFGSFEKDNDMET